MAQDRGSGHHGSLTHIHILIEPTMGKAERLLKALRQAGFGTTDLIDAQGILAHEITVFNDRVRIDALTSTPGLTFQDAWNERQTMDYQGQ